MKKITYLSRMSLFVLLFVTYLIAVSCSEKESENLETVSIQSATFGNYNTSNSNTLIAYYYFGNSNTPTINVEGYNPDYTYELKLTGKYYEQEYTLSLNEEESDVIVKGEDGVKNISELAKSVVPEENVAEEETGVSLIVDITELDLQVDDYIVTIVEVESNEEKDVASADGLLALDANYKTYVIDNDATNFLSGTQIESDGWAQLSELNLNTHASFRVRPTIVNYINGIGVVLGVYDLEANKIGYVQSNGSNGSGAGTYSYIFTATKLDDLITEDGEYLVRLEERTSTVDADDTGYRNGLFQKINITKITNSGHVFAETK